MAVSGEGIREQALSRAIVIGLAASLALTSCGGEDERPVVPVSEVCPTEDELLGDSALPETPGEQLKKTQKVAADIARAALADIQELQERGEAVTVYEAETPGISSTPTYAYGVPPVRTPLDRPVVALELTHPGQLFVRFQRDRVESVPTVNLTASFSVPDDWTGKPTPQDFAAVASATRPQLDNLTYNYGAGADSCGGTLTVLESGNIVRAANIDDRVFTAGVNLDTALGTAGAVLDAARISAK